MVQGAYKEDGVRYIQWAANLALGFNVGIPWVMCKQKDAPGSVVSLSIKFSYEQAERIQP